MEAHDRLPPENMWKGFSTDPLEREAEREYAEQFKEERQNFAALVLTLPKELRPLILADGVAGPRNGAKWPLRELEACYGRMLEHLPGHEDLRTERILREAKRSKRRIESAREALILSHLRFVVHVVKTVDNYGVPLTDLIQEGTIGLIAAVEKFEPERGNRLSTFAYWWILKGISEALAEKPSIIRLPMHVRRRIRAVKRAARELSGTLERSPTPQEISRRARVSVEQIAELAKIVPTGPLEAANDNGMGGILHYVPDTSSPDPFEDTLNHEMKQKVHAALDRLLTREALIIRLRFGLGYRKRYTLKQIGEIVALSRERVRQIEIDTLKILQATMEPQKVFRMNDS